MRQRVCVNQISSCPVRLLVRPACCFFTTLSCFSTNCLWKLACCNSQRPSFPSRSAWSTYVCIHQLPQAPHCTTTHLLHICLCHVKTCCGLCLLTFYLFFRRTTIVCDQSRCNFCAQQYSLVYLESRPACIHSFTRLTSKACCHRLLRCAGRAHLVLACQAETAHLHMNVQAQTPLGFGTSNHFK